VVRADQLEEAGGPGQVAVGGALPRGPAGSGRVPGCGEEAALDYRGLLPRQQDVQHNMSNDLDDVTCYVHPCYGSDN
jgi:hypothetical protein